MRGAIGVSKARSVARARAAAAGAVRDLERAAALDPTLTRDVEAPLAEARRLNRRTTSAAP
jgi:hypothetical protein